MLLARTGALKVLTLPFFSAYRIHLSRSTVQTLLSLDKGYKIDIRGQTELKVRDFLFLDWWEKSPKA